MKSLMSVVTLLVVAVLLYSVLEVDGPPSREVQDSDPANTQAAGKPRAALPSEDLQFSTDRQTIERGEVQSQAVIDLKAKLVEKEAELVLCRQAVSAERTTARLEKWALAAHQRLEDCLAHGGHPSAAFLHSAEVEGLPDHGRSEISKFLREIPVYLEPGEATVLWSNWERWSADGRDEWIAAIQDVIGADRLVAQLRQHEWANIWVGFSTEQMKELYGEEYNDLFEADLAKHRR